MDTGQRSYLPLRQVDWRIVVGFVASLTVCLTFYRQLEYVATGQHRPALLTFLEESTGGLAGLSIFPLTYLVATRFPLLSPRWRTYLLIHLAALCGISVIHTSLIALLRRILLPLFGFPDEYGYLPMRYPMEFAHLFIFYWVGVSLIYFFHEVRFRQQRELREAQLEASLSETQLQNLRLQLEPHFLFNALNAISEAVYENPRTADEMIGRLSELLRHLLKSDRAQEVPLERELELLRLYLSVMQTRFEDRLQVAFDIDEAAQSAVVPQLVLQPLVENAIRHGMDPRTFRIQIDVAAQRQGDQLVLTVRDRGPGFDTNLAEKRGIGLRNTRERLARLYGTRQSVVTANADSGGAIAALRLPFSRQLASS